MTDQVTVLRTETLIRWAHDGNQLSIVVEHRSNEPLHTFERMLEVASRQLDRDLATYNETGKIP